MRRLKARAIELYQKGVFRAASSQVVLSGLGRLGENGTRLYGKMKLLWMFNALNLGSKPKSQNLNPAPAEASLRDAESRGLSEYHPGGSPFEDSGSWCRMSDVSRNLILFWGTCYLKGTTMK